MAEIQAEQTALFDFMVVRAPEEVSGSKLRRRYIRDWGMDVPAEMSASGAGVSGLPAASKLAKIIVKKVSAWQGEPGDPAALKDLFNAIIEAAPELGLIPRRGLLPSSGPPALKLGELEAGAYLVDNTGDYYLLPDRLDRLEPASLYSRLAQASQLLDAVSRASESPPLDKAQLLKALEFALGRPAGDYVFGSNTSYVLRSNFSAESWYLAHRAVFDALYLLYVARRWTTVNLEPMIAALRALHAIFALAADAVVATAMTQPSLSAAELKKLQALSTVWPELANWNRKGLPPGFPLIGSRGQLRDYLTAQPLIHPLFARLFWYRRPFNEVKPIGVGDLKVVRQWLTAYRKGEISHIHNIVKGERRSRDHRRLEKTEETFGFTDSRSEDTSQDHQSTERFEVKAEAEQVLRTALNVNATANSTLSYEPTTAMKVTASVGLGFAYNRASEDHQKTAHNFARDVVDKAVSRVESKTASTRTTTKLFETEEMNSQTFDNKDGKAHVSGIYRWVDKEYTAQLFNYGKRLMFEFAVPEPAAFWIESRLRAFESELDVPQPPEWPEYGKTELKFEAADIDYDLYSKLSGEYDLSAIPFRAPKKYLGLRLKDTGDRHFEEKDITTVHHNKVFDCHVDGLNGYELESARLNGYAEFEHHGTPTDPNVVSVEVDNRLVWAEPRTDEQWPLGRHEIPNEAISFAADDTTLTLAFRGEIKFYRLQVGLDLRLTDSARLAWQRDVYQAVWQVEDKKVKSVNQKLELAYESELAEYRNRLAQLDAVRVAEVLQGGPEAANRAVINEEIKKHCLTLMTKEFDTVDADDLLSKKSAIGARTVKATSTRFAIDENNETEPYTKAGFIHPSPDDMCYPAIDIKESRTKGKVVQFLEQAFEWELVSYVFYPYFWAEQTRWIELMNRADLTDSTFTAFLRSGMARVLVAVTPGYDDAVLHYLCTREPWDGGPSPVIGDPLFIPLYEEIRQQQDDRLGGVPEGKSWTFTVPTSLVYLHESSTPLPDLVAETKARQGTKELVAGEGVQNGEVARR